MKTYLIIDTIHLCQGPRWNLFIDDVEFGGALTKISSHATREDAEAAKAERMRKDAEAAQ